MATFGRVRFIVLSLLLLVVAGCSTASVIDERPYPLTTPSVSVQQIASCGLGALPTEWSTKRLLLASGGTSYRLLAHDSVQSITYFLKTTKSQQLIVRRTEDGDVVIFRNDDAENWSISRGVAVDSWFAFVVEPTYYTNDFLLYLWDSRSNEQPKIVAKTTTDENGETVPGPSINPVIVNGKLYWQQVQADGKMTILTARNLADGTITEFPARRGSWSPVLFGDLLVWREYGPKGAHSVVRARDIATGEEVSPPVAIESAVSTYIASDRRTLVWVSPRDDHGRVPEPGEVKTEINYARTDGTSGKFMVPGSVSSNIYVSGDYLAVVADNERGYIIDLTTGQYAALTAELGGGTLDSGVMVVEEAPGGVDTFWMLRLDEVPPLPACK